MSKFNTADVVTIRPTLSTMTRQQLPNFVGISGTTAGAGHLSMNLVVIPPGGAAQPHVHQGYETAIYLLSGRVETRYGPGLRRSVIHEAGDFISYSCRCTPSAGKSECNRSCSCHCGSE